MKVYEDMMKMQKRGGNKMKISKKYKLSFGGLH